MSTGEVRKVSREDIQLVQNLIERCLQLYMSQKEVVSTLLVQAKIEPGFTELVWQKLEEENRDFFKAYHLRLMLKDQIILFNRLLERQVEVMHHICPDGVASAPISNGSHIPPPHQNSAGYTLDPSGHGMKSENTSQPMGLSLPNTFANGVSSLHPCMQNAIDMSVHAPSMMLTQSPNAGMMQVMNGGIIKSEAGYSGSSPYVYDNDGDVLEAAGPVIGDPPVSSFSSAESTSHPLLDGDGSSLGFLGQIPRNFSLSDLTADFPNSSDILDYSRSPFLAADTDDFLDRNGRGEYHGSNASG